MIILMKMIDLEMRLSSFLKDYSNPSKKGKEVEVSKGTVQKPEEEELEDPEEDPEENKDE